MSFDYYSLDDIEDVRDVIERFEELEDDEDRDEKEQEEFEAIGSLLDDLKGYGGDEQWRGDWYPLTLISEDYFTDYCKDLVQDIGDLPNGIPSYIEIDWDATAKNLRVDYSEVEINGNTYLYR